MRRAMFMSGHLRSMSTAAAQHMKSQFDGDIFVATWDKNDCADTTPVTEEAIKQLNAVRVEISNFEAALESAKHKNAYFERYRTFQSNCHKGRHGYDSFCMFHLMKRAWLMLKEYENQQGFKYDVVIRFRPDYIFHGLPADFQPAKDCVYFPENTAFFNLTDNLFVADRETMDKMMLLPDLVDTYLLRESATWGHKHLILHHLQAAKIHQGKIPTFLYTTGDGSPPGQDRSPVIFEDEKIIATILARNEEDIIEDCIRHALANGVDEIILTDNGSTDRTREIAAQFSRVTIIDEPSNEYRQGEWQSRMSEVAMDHGATWVVPIDADEFWEGIDNLRIIPKVFGVAVATCLFNHNHTDLIEDEKPFDRSMMPTYSRLERQFGRWMSGRFAFRPYRGIKIGMGQDNIQDYNGGAIGVLHEMWVHHYPIRSYKQYVQKITNGVAALDAGKHDLCVGSHWREAYQKLAHTTLKQEYDQTKTYLKCRKKVWENT